MIFQKRSDGFVKRAICKAHKPWKGEAYLWYAAVTKDAAQHRSWTFYEAVKENDAWYWIGVPDCIQYQASGDRTRAGGEVF